MLSGAAAMVLASLASAQGAQATAAATATAQLAAAATADAQATIVAANTGQPANVEQLQEVTVTGSRVIQSGLDSPTPLTSINMGSMSELQPTTVADQLNDLPTFSGSRNQFTNASTGNLGTGPAAPNPSANVLNLRNMGYLRTLVLYDGKRVPATSPDGTTDVNMIPQMLLQRVDIVTGGASAVYGSDAVTGVVNFITNTHFTGLKVQANAGISGDYDDRTYDQGVAWGKDLFGGRGHFEMSLENRSDPSILYRNQRQWGRDVWTMQGAGAAADPYRLVENTRIGTSTFGGLITSGPLAGQQFTSDGYLAPCVTGSPTGTKGIYSGGCGAYNNSSFAASLQMDQAFARFDYDFSDSVHGDV
ncbi:MAG: TonB-dependent receptor plug domain-containing protein, partial [Chloroflexota bacterium]